VEWAFFNPQNGAGDASNPVVVAGLVCTATAPYSDDGALYFPYPGGFIRYRD
jgi:hypothetical protein